MTSFAIAFVSLAFLLGAFAFVGLPTMTRRRRTGLAEVFLRGPDRPAAAGRHLAPDPLASQVLPRRDLFRLDFLPIALELFGDELDETRDRPLSHL